MGRSQTEIALMTIFKAQQFFAIEAPSAGFLPQFRGGGNGHKELLGASPVHFLTNDLFDFPNDSETEREIRVDAGGDFTNQTGSEHELMADGFRFARVFS
jgi:hypothetical protein